VINAQVAVSTRQSSGNKHSVCVRDLMVKLFIITCKLTRDMQQTHQKVEELKEPITINLRSLSGVNPAFNVVYASMRCF